jgi:hypothetical protein
MGSERRHRAAMISVRLTAKELEIITSAAAKAKLSMSAYVRERALLGGTEWFITTELFRRGGRVIAGPFSTGRNAQIMREAIEAQTGNLTYWIDSKERP